MMALGIDPGTIRTGYGICRKDGGRISHISSGIIKLNTNQTFEQRLVPLFNELERILVSFGPDEAAVESLFFAKNAMSALKLGHARGVIMLALAQKGLPISSYAPTMVKRSIVGAGRAPKGQMQKTIQGILRLKRLPEEDEADALAIAICHLNAPKIPHETVTNPMLSRLKLAIKRP